MAILAGYGLMSTVGPQEPTKADIKRLNSRSGGEIRGFGNWMQSFNPGPIIKSGGPDKMYDYGQKVPVVVQARLPGLETRKVSTFKGYKTPKSSIKIGRDVDGSQSIPVIGPVVGEKKEENKKAEDVFEENAEKDNEPMSPRSSTTSRSSTSSSGPPTPVDARFVPHVRPPPPVPHRAPPPVPEVVVPNPNIGPNPIRQQNRFGLPEDEIIVDALPKDDIMDIKADTLPKVTSTRKEKVKKVMVRGVERRTPTAIKKKTTKTKFNDKYPGVVLPDTLPAPRVDKGGIKRKAEDDLQDGGKIPRLDKGRKKRKAEDDIQDGGKNSKPKLTINTKGPKRAMPMKIKKLKK